MRSCRRYALGALPRSPQKTVARASTARVVRKKVVMIGPPELFVVKYIAPNASAMYQNQFQLSEYHFASD